MQIINIDNVKEWLQIAECSNQDNPAEIYRELTVNIARRIDTEGISDNLYLMFTLLEEWHLKTVVAAYEAGRRAEPKDSTPPITDQEIAEMQERQRQKRESVKEKDG